MNQSNSPMHDGKAAPACARPPVLKALVVILDRDKVQAAHEYFRACHLFLSMTVMAHGTVGSEMMDILGLDNTDKALLLALGTEGSVWPMLEMLKLKFRLDRRGSGIAFSLPLSGVALPILHNVSEATRAHIQQKVEKEVEKAMNTGKFDLIVSVVNEGHLDEVMHAARKAGAQGGTVFLARHADPLHTVSFLGLEVQAEKEVVCILCRHEQKHDIMTAINQACGMRTDARGMVFSLPVDAIEGFGSEN